MRVKKWLLHHGERDRSYHNVFLFVQKLPAYPIVSICYVLRYDMFCCADGIQTTPIPERIVLILIPVS